MDDNVREHRAQLVHKYLQSENIQRLEWLAIFPELNPIEHVWEVPGRSIAARRLAPITIDELKSGGGCQRLIRTLGVAFLNEFNLGRYWPIIGPQITLYAPSILFQKSPASNSITLLELENSPCHKNDTCTVQFIDTPIVNGTTPQY
ncbi:beta-galactosidase [Trichonephila clavipes]|nr:beta-galactosidase [Trichonephila clavipes]